MGNKRGQFGFPLLRTQVLSIVSEQVDDAIEQAAGDSPIEKLFHAALVSFFNFRSTEFDGVLAPEDQDSLARLIQAEQSKRYLIVERQVMVGDWRVDFLVHMWTHGAVWQRGMGSQEGPPRWRKLIVECDGHEFHERTKEQAAKDRSRDRQAALDGFDVFRFTGSELWRDPLGCVEHVYSWAVKGI